MANLLVNNSWFLATSTGTGTFTLSSAVTGFMTPSAAGATSGGTYSYRASNADNSEWEIGTGTLTIGGSTTLTRTVLKSSNSNSAVSFTTAPIVALTLLAADIPPNVSDWPVFIAAFSGTQSLTSAGFRTLELTASTDTHSGFNSGTYIYTIPQTGMYEMVGKVRLADGTSNFSHGLGIDTANQDSPTFLWKNTEAGGSGQQRNGLLNQITAALTAGDQMRMFCYPEQSASVIASSLTILRVR